MLLAAVVVLVALSTAAGAQGLEPPANDGCGRTAVVAKLSIVEDRAAANMLAEAVRILGLGGRCLVDAGDPDNDQLPAGSRADLAGSARVFVVGGPAAIPDEWLISRLGVGPYTRVSGSDRWATQSAVAHAIISLAADPLTDPGPGESLSPSNTDCSGSAVLANLDVVEDRAAANLLAEALRWLSPTGAKCLVDAGDPVSGTAPSRQARDDYAYSEAQFVVGGPAAISGDWLDAHFGQREFVRIAGLDRWGTQAAVASRIVVLARGGDATAAVGAIDVVVSAPSSEGLATDAQAEIRDVTVGVFYCAEAGTYSTSQLEDEVRRIDDVVGGFYRGQFGDSDYALSFKTGKVLSPDIDWSNFTIASWRTNDGQSECNEALKDEMSGSGGAFELRRSLIVAAVEFGGTTWGFARTPPGPAVVATRSTFPAGTGYKYSQENYYYTAIAHELGHLIYGFDHPHPDDSGCGGGSVSSEELMSVMAWPRCGADQNITGKTAYVACAQRESLGWVPPGSCDGKGPPPDRPVITGLHPGAGSLTMRWSEPNSYRSAVAGYQVLYRRADASSPRRSWRSSELFTSRSVTITGLTDGVPYEVKVRAESVAGFGGFSRTLKESPRKDSASRPTVTLRVGGDARGAIGADGPCTGAHCRWLEVEVKGLGPAPHTLACAHNGVVGIRPGVYNSGTVSSGPIDSTCLFGYPGAEIYVIVGAEHRNGAWHGGHYSNVIRWPDCNAEPERCAGQAVAPQLEASDRSIGVRLGSSILFDIQYKRSVVNASWTDWNAVEYVQLPNRDNWTYISGLTNGITYEIRLRPSNSSGNPGWSVPSRATPRESGTNPSVTLSVGGNAQGAQGVTGPCTSVHCRWLHIEASGLEPGPYKVECWHHAFGQFSHGRWKSATVSQLSDESICLFGFPGATVYVVVNGIKSNEVIW